jgi:hypothetical protein
MQNSTVLLLQVIEPGKRDMLQVHTVSGTLLS